MGRAARVNPRSTEGKTGAARETALQKQAGRIHEERERRAAEEHARVMARLRELAPQIPTRRHFEDMVLLHPHPEQFRALMQPLMRTDLPCCQHAWNEPHESRCPDHRPDPRLIVTPEEATGIIGSDEGFEPGTVLGADGRIVHG